MKIEPHGQRHPAPHQIAAVAIAAGNMCQLAT